MRKEYHLRLARILRDAVADARKLEKTPGFILNMNVFCRPATSSNYRKCEVCLGGAYAILHLKEPKNVPSDSWSHEARNLMKIVDCMRVGDFFDAADRLTNCNGEVPLKDDVLERVGELVDTGYVRNLNGKSRASWATYLIAARILEGSL